MLRKLPNSSFRFIFLLATFFIIGFGVYLQIRSLSLPTDENFFTDPPSRIINIEKIVGFQKENEIPEQDFIPEGSLIISVNNFSTTDTISLIQAINLTKDVANVKFFDRKKNLIRNIFVKRSQLNLAKFSYLGSAVIIFWVKSGGASEEAGLKPGDIIISINRQKFSNQRQADLLLINSNPSKPVKYEILRGNEIITKEIKLAAFNITFDSIYRFLIGTIFLFFALLFGLKHCNEFPIRLLALSFLLLSAIFITTYHRGGEGFLIGQIWVVVVAFSLALSFGFLSHFLLYFPIEQQKLLGRKKIVATIYVISSLTFFLILVSFFFLPGNLSSFILNLSFLPIVGYRIALNLFYKREIIPDPHRIGKKLLSFFRLIVIIIIIYTVSLWIYSEYESVLSIMFYSLLGFFPLLFFYLLNKFRFFGIYYKIRRNFLYIVTKLGLDLFFLVLIVLTFYTLSIITIKFPNLHLAGTKIEVLNRPLPAHKNFQYEKVAIILFSLLFILLVYKIKKKTNKFLLKKFYRAKFDYKKTAAELSELIIQNISLPDLARNVVRELEKSMFLKKVVLLIYQDNNLCCLEFFKEKEEEFISVLKEKYSFFLELAAEAEGLTSFNLVSDPFAKLMEKYNYLYFLPIKYEGKVLGTLLLGEKLSETRYTFEDIEFLEIVSKNIAIAILNSLLFQELANQERYKQELEIAQKIQFASLPKEMPNPKGLSVAAVTIPALEVGGDFFDFLQNGDKFTVVVGDVSGKGISAALYMSKIQGILRTLNEFNLSLKEMLLKTNELLVNSIEKNYYISAILCQFDVKNSIATLVRAGHLALYLFDGTEKCINKIIPPGIVLGILPTNKFEETCQVASLPYKKNDCFVFITDGVIEDQLKGEVFSKEKKLIEVIEKNFDLTPNQLTEKILTDVCFGNDNQKLFDDLTILVVKPN